MLELSFSFFSLGNSLGDRLKYEAVGAPEAKVARTSTHGQRREGKASLTASPLPACAHNAWHAAHAQKHCGMNECTSLLLVAFFPLHHRSRDRLSNRVSLNNQDWLVQSQKTKIITTRTDFSRDKPHHPWCVCLPRDNKVPHTGCLLTNSGNWKSNLKLDRVAIREGSAPCPCPWLCRWSPSSHRFPHTHVCVQTFSS